MCSHLCWLRRRVLGPGSPPSHFCLHRHLDINQFSLQFLLYLCNISNAIVESTITNSYLLLKRCNIRDSDHDIKANYYYLCTDIAASRLPDEVSLAQRVVIWASLCCPASPGWLLVVVVHVCALLSLAALLSHSGYSWWRHPAWWRCDREHPPPGSPSGKHLRCQRH